MNAETCMFTGTGVAIITPFNTDYSVDFAALEQLIDFQINHKVDYLVVLGTTGETATLTDDEKKSVYRFVIDKAKGRVPVVLGIGGNNTYSAIEKLKSWDLTGVSAILSVCPYYNKPSQEGIYQHFKAIAEATTLPVILYNVPPRTGINMCPDTTLRLAREFKNVIAIKEASANMGQCLQLLKEKPAGFGIISGDDALTIPMMSLGACGVISVAANALPFEVSESVRQAQKGDFKQASTLYFKIHDAVNALFTENNPAGIKAMLHVKGMIKNVLRLPLVPVSDKNFELIRTLTK